MPKSFVSALPPGGWTGSLGMAVARVRMVEGRWRRRGFGGFMQDGGWRRDVGCFAGLL